MLQVDLKDAFIGTSSVKFSNTSLTSWLRSSEGPFSNADKNCTLLGSIFVYFVGRSRDIHPRGPEKWRKNPNLRMKFSKSSHE